jgi:iron complex transport system permease protein
VRTGTRAAVWSTGLAALLLVVAVVSAGIGPVAVPPATVAKALVNAVPVPTGVEWTGGAGLPLGLAPPRVTVSRLDAFPVEEKYSLIVLSIRMPRIALAAVVGFALAAAGTVMQGFFRNPMADPSIIGVSSGAAAGAVASIVVPAVLPFGLDLQAAAFLGALVTAFVVYAVATEGGRTPVATLLLAGVAIQTFLGAVVSYLLLIAGESVNEALYWLMGHLSGAGWDEAALAALLVAPLFGLLLVYTRDLNVLLMGEEDARALGVEVERTKRLLLAASSLVTAAAVAVTGVIGFVGLIVPHALRLVVGPDHRVLLPASAVAGATFLVATDTVARTAMGGTELPVGIVTAALGAPFFLYLLRDREVHAL